MPFEEVLTVSRESPQDVIDVHEALRELGELNPRQANIAELRFFAGMTSAEVAQHLGVSRSTVDREWRVAKAWLRQALSQDHES